MKDSIRIAEIEQKLQEQPPSEIKEFLADPYRIDRESVAFYRENGYIKLKQVLFGVALRYYRELIGQAVSYTFRDDNRLLADKSVYQQSFLQASNLWQRYPAIESFTKARRFANIAKNLMEVSGVRLWFDQALYKEAGGRLTDYHQDAGLWPVSPPDKTTTMWIALVNVPVVRGCLSFARGSHIGPNNTEFVDIWKAEQELVLPEKLAGFQWDEVPLNAGDCTFHNGMTYHRAASNKTGKTREAMTVVYMTDQAVYDFPESNPKADRHKSQTQGLSRGEIIDSPLAPRLATDFSE
jgi:ectoine hydroxylase-related dioxygenase (phytanoyl-CoA dioxygenase family)